jgi:hypothetical protein
VRYDALKAYLEKNEKGSTRWRAIRKIFTVGSTSGARHTGRRRKTKEDDERRLSADCIALLDQLPEWDWRNAREDKWPSKYNALKAGSTRRTEGALLPRCEYYYVETGQREYRIIENNYEKTTRT